MTRDSNHLIQLGCREIGENEYEMVSFRRAYDMRCDRGFYWWNEILLVGKGGDYIYG